MHGFHKRTMTSVWPSAATVGSTNRAEESDSHMSPSQMTVQSRARSHCYITSTVLHQCTESFPMNNTERQGCRRGHGHRAGLPNDRDKKKPHCYFILYINIQYNTLSCIPISSISQQNINNLDQSWIGTKHDKK